MGEEIPIGQLAALTRLSAKALRLYDESGLLRPARVDPESGYRYYRQDQAGQARLIRLLRAADMPLAEIAAFLREPTVGRLEEYAEALKARQAERERVLRYVGRLLETEEDPMAWYEVKVKEVASQPYVSRSAVVSIGELAAFIAGAFDELRATAEPDGAAFVLYHEPVNAEADGRVEACLPTRVREAGGGELPAGSVAFTMVEGDQFDFPEVLSAYDAVASWARRNGHDLAGPPREIYRFAAGESPRVEITWPIA